MLNDLATKYGAKEFIKDKAIITKAMEVQLKELFTTECQADVSQVQMFDINLPVEFDDMLTETSIEVEK